METSEDQPKVLKKQSLHDKVLEALSSNTKSKGLSLQGIKKFIIEKNPEMTENFSNKRLRTAITKGLESETIKKKSPEQGFNGYFLLNKQAGSSKEKKKAPKTLDTEKAKKTPKSRKESEKSSTKTVKSKPVAKTNKTATKTKITAPKPKTSSKTTPKRPLTPKPTNTKVVSRKKASTMVPTPKTSKADVAGKQSRKLSVKKLLK